MPTTVKDNKNQSLSAEGAFEIGASLLTVGAYVALGIPGILSSAGVYAFVRLTNHFAKRGRGCNDLEGAALSVCLIAGGLGVSTALSHNLLDRVGAAQATARSNALAVAAHALTGVDNVASEGISFTAPITKWAPFGEAGEEVGKVVARVVQIASKKNLMPRAVWPCGFRSMAHLKTSRFPYVRLIPSMIVALQGVGAMKSVLSNKQRRMGCLRFFVPSF